MITLVDGDTAPVTYCLLLLNAHGNLVNNSGDRISLFKGNKER